MQIPAFNSFFWAGVECSTHRTTGVQHARRLDLIRSSRHDLFFEQDYALFAEEGLRTVRSGLRWHRIERGPGVFDFAPDLPRVWAAEQAGLQVVWDLMHFGWPDDLDIFSPAFVDRFAAFASAFARVLKQETDQTPVICPVNEISFLAWAGGHEALINPFCVGRSDELKAQLVRAAIAGMEAVWQVWPAARFLHVDPAIHIVCDPNTPEQAEEAAGWHQAQFQAWDMLAGRIRPELGGHPKYLDVVGVNFYPNNEWVYQGPTILRSSPLYRPFRAILAEMHARYGRPMVVAETGAEDELRAGWLRYVAQEVSAAVSAGVPIHGLCWYPIFNHPGWEDDRYCHNGLWDYPDTRGARRPHAPLLDELRRQQQVFAMKHGHLMDHST